MESYFTCNIGRVQGYTNVGLYYRKVKQNSIWHLTTCSLSNKHDIDIFQVHPPFPSLYILTIHCIPPYRVIHGFMY